MTCDDFEDLLRDPFTQIGARQIVDDALRRLDPRVADLCQDRLRGFRARSQEARRNGEDDE